MSSTWNGLNKICCIKWLSEKQKSKVSQVKGRHTQILQFFILDDASLSIILGQQIYILNFTILYYAFYSKTCYLKRSALSHVETILI